MQSIRREKRAREKARKREERRDQGHSFQNEARYRGELQNWAALDPWKIKTVWRGVVIEFFHFPPPLGLSFIFFF